MKDINKYNPGKLGDYIIFCDQCGAPCWKSEATRLKVETGNGGLWVCPRDVDPIDYGLVPYKIRAEKPVPVARINTFADYENIPTSKAPITDFETFNLYDNSASSSSQTEIQLLADELISVSDNYVIGG